MQDVADAEIDRDRIPRRADAERVDMSVLQALHHVGRRQHDEAHILVRIDAARRHPEAQMIIVRRERKRHAEGQRVLAARLALRHNAGERPRRHHRVADVAFGRVASAACSAGDTVMALPFIPRPNGATIGTFMWPRPRLDAIATGAIRCAASNKPMLSLSRTFDHETSRTSSTSRPSAAQKPLSTAISSAAASASGMNPMRSVAHLNSSAAVMTDCATSAIFLFSFIAVLRSSA